MTSLIKSELGKTRIFNQKQLIINFYFKKIIIRLCKVSFQISSKIIIMEKQRYLKAKTIFRIKIIIKK